MPKTLSESDIKQGDAIIVFSRKEALLKKEIFEDLGLKVSIIYGMLSPEVRKNQAKLFLDGETDIVVSTDAIGMGLNLPIKRVIFTTLFKYYNKTEHVITNSEIKQIAGRAGRYKLYPEGFIGLLDQKYNNKWSFKDVSISDIEYENRYMMDKIKQAMSVSLSPLSKPILGPDLEILEYLNIKLKDQDLEEMTVLEYLNFFQKISVDQLFVKASIEEMINQSMIVQAKVGEIKNIDFRDIFKFTVAPLIIRNNDHLDEFERLVENYFNCENSSFTKSRGNELFALESSLKVIEIFQWISNQFEYYFNHNEEELRKYKDEIISKIEKEFKK